MTVARKFDVSSLLAGGSLILLTSLLTWIAYRGTRCVGFDPHYYLEYTKQFRTEFPASFGTHWPFGFPLFGTALTRLGLSSFSALLVVSALGWAVIGALLWRPLLAACRRADLSGAMLLVFGTTAVAVIELGTLRSEIIFTAFSVASLVAIAESDSRRAWFAAVALVVIGFCLRYVGILGLATLGLWFLHREKQPWYRGVAVHKLLILTGGAVLCGALMLWNVQTRGYASGAPRTAGPGFAGLAPIVSDLGWGSLIAFSTVGIKNVVTAPAGSLAVGWSATALLILVVVQAWRHPVSVYSRPFSLGLGVYLVGMVGFAAAREFDSLSNGRTFIPALPLVFILAIERCRERLRLILPMTLLLISIPGVLVTARGISPQLSPDYAPLVKTIAPQLLETDSIGVNLPAVGLSAWVDQKVTRIDDSSLPPTAHAWLVLAADLEGGRQPVPVWPEATRQLITQLEAGGQFKRVFENSQLSAWRRAPSPSH